MKQNARFLISYPKVEYSWVSFVKDTGSMVDFQICFLAISGGSPIQNSDEPEIVLTI